MNKLILVLLAFCLFFEAITVSGTFGVTPYQFTGYSYKKKPKNVSSNVSSYQYVLVCRSLKPQNLQLSYS